MGLKTVCSLNEEARSPGRKACSLCSRKKSSSRPRRHLDTGDSCPPRRLYQDVPMREHWLEMIKIIYLINFIYIRPKDVIQIM